MKGTGIVPGVSEQQADLARSIETEGPSGESKPEADTVQRRPGEPHPYMLQRNPPNLWILVALTVFSLLLAFLILAVTVVL